MERTENREMQITRTFKAPIELMWEVWTSPEHVINWWGPNGFTSTIHKMDVKEGGEWTLTMHGPDGTDYANRSIFKEIVPFKKIVFEHFNPHFIATILFEPKGEETQMDWSMLFDTAEMRETIIRVHKADDGQKQNIEKLEKYLDQVKFNLKK
ncbi:SRPBCC family protein [Mucilaginibacter mallensis]|nr:SRPBCC family protein [Mucilaginibacter mallensis]